MLDAIENRIKAANEEVVVPSGPAAQVMLQLTDTVGNEAATGLAETAGPHAEYLAELTRAQCRYLLRLRLTNLPCPLRPVNVSFWTTTMPREITVSTLPSISKPS
jgi:hypothetical protein